MKGFLRKLFRKKELTVEEELQKAMKRVDDAYGEYKRNPNLGNMRHLDEVLTITENFVYGVEAVLNEG